MMNIPLLAVLLVLGPAAAAKPARPPAPPQTMIDASFECPVPPGWTALRDETGLRLAGPSDRAGLAALAMVRYVPPGDKHAPSPDAYLKKQTEAGPYAPEGDSAGPVEELTVAGRPARRVERRTKERVGGGFESKLVAKRELHVVVPAEKGFYVLLLLTPESLAKRAKRDFGAVLAGFKPKL
jgi:hypothetical protein